MKGLLQFVTWTFFGFAFTIACASLDTPQAEAQNWRIPTPRDTVFVPANQLLPTQGSRFNWGTAVSVNLYVSGTFGAFPGQNGSGFDGRYTFNIPNWSAPYPLANPPSFNHTSYQIFLAINTDGSNEDSIRVLESAYQPSHQYTARYQGHGSNFQFRVKDRLNESPSGYYYGQATGGLTIRMAQFTAGVAVKSSDLNFSYVNVGSSSTLLDSIASYGIDPLSVDSVWIDGPNADDFHFNSQRGSRFTLPNESANEISVTYSPAQAAASQATLHIHSSNADGPDRSRTITLEGVGAAPNEEFNTSILDFGKVRVTYPAYQYVNIFNAGTAALSIVRISDDGGAPVGVFSVNPVISYPDSIKPGAGSIRIQFNPQGLQSYREWMYFWAAGGRKDSALLLGEGAEPIFTINQPVLDFGTVRTNDTAVRMDIVSNVGNWTANITYVGLGGSNGSSFSVQPDTNGFLLDEGDSRTYTITFHPNTQTDVLHTAELRFYFDNGAASQAITLTGREAKPRLKYDTNFVDFGRVKLFNTAARNVGVRNSSGIQQSFVETVPVPVFQVTKPKPFIFDTNRSTIELTFQPTFRGQVGAWMQFNAANQQDSIYLLGFGAAALPVFNPPTIDFNVVPSGTTNYRSSIATDTGDYPLYICDLHISGPDSSYFTIPNLAHPLPDSILPDGKDSRFLGVDFSTSANTGRDYYATLEIRYCDGTLDTIPLHAKEATRSIQYSTPNINFGKVHVGATSIKPAQFWNGENIMLYVGTMWATPASGPFTSSGTNLGVPANGLASISVSFIPPSRGVFTGYHHAKDRDMKEDSIQLTGIGVAAVPQLDTKLVDLGVVAFGQTSSAKSVTLTNAGDWPLHATLTKFRDKYDEFKIQTPNSNWVDSVAYDSAANGKSRSYSVTFTPRFPQLPHHDADLILAFDDGTTQTVHLTARDLTEYLVLDSSRMNFGKVRIGKPAATQTFNIVNTWDKQLTDTILQAPTAPFSMSRGAPITVGSNDSTSIQVTFAPTAIGAAQSVVVGKGSVFLQGTGDSLILEGIGAAPVPQLATDTLDFGTLAVGHPGNQSDVLTNAGNWPLYTHWTITGPDSPDFSPTIALDTLLAEGTSSNFHVGFVATTPLQATPRTATIIFTDTEDGSTFRLVLIARDKPPAPERISFGNYARRLGDKFEATLQLLDAIPDSIGVQHLKGTVTFDPSIVTLLGSPNAGWLVPSPNWTLAVSNMQRGSFDYDLSSTTDTLRGPGTLLRINMEVRTDAEPGKESPLTSSPAFPATPDIVAQAFDGVVVVEGPCSTTTLSSGDATASFIQQNSPNPFGGNASMTTLPFDVGDDGTMVTIRILNPTGEEVLRPLDHVAFARGRYTIPVRAVDLGSGAYFYEFQADGKKPQVLKMTVQ